MAFTMITMMPAAPAGVIYGAVADSFGYRVSFAVAAGLIGLGIGLTLLLPRRPPVG
jgi:hypothetical protein